MTNVDKKIKKIFGQPENRRAPLTEITEKLTQLQNLVQEESDPHIARAKRMGRFASRLAQIQQVMTSSTYRTSPTFFDPFGIAINVGSGITAFYLFREKGVERPHVLDFITTQTKRLYHHESGVIASLEERDKLRSVVRIPVEVIRLLGVESVSKRFPGIEKALTLEKYQNPQDETIYFEGDIKYEREFSWKKFGKNKTEWELPYKSYPDFVRGTWIKLDDAIKAIDSRLKTTDPDKAIKPRTGNSVADFVRSGPVNQRYDFEGAVLQANSYPNSQILARVLSSHTTREEGLKIEVRVPIDTFRVVKPIWIAHHLSLGYYTTFPLFGEKAFSTLEVYNDYRNRVNVEQTGDFVHDSPLQNRRDFAEVTDKVNDLGKDYINKKTKSRGSFFL